MKETFNETLKDIILISLGIIIILMVIIKGCNKTTYNQNESPKFIYKSDTVFSVDTLVKLKTIYKPKYDTIYKLDTINSEIDVDSLFYVRYYNDSISDSTQTIFYKTRVIGILDELELSYKMKPKPVLITNNITKIETIYKQPKISIYTGIEAGGSSTSFNLSPFINVNSNNVSVGYRYGLLDKSHNIKIGYNIFSSKK